MSIEIYNKHKLERAFSEALSSINATELTKVYVSNVLSNSAANFSYEFIGKSIVLSYSDIKYSADLKQHQSLADWILLSSIMIPEQYNENINIVIDIGRFSYYNCWRLLNGQWGVYEELSDNLKYISASARSKIRNNFIRKEDVIINFL